MPNMVQAFHDDLMILVHTGDPPTEEEWKRYIEALAKADPEKLRTLCFTDGGAPNSAQRKKVNEVLKGKTSMGAIISHQMLVRSVVTALSWFNPKIKAFSPDETDKALRYLGVPELRVSAIWEVVRRLRVELGEPNLRSIAAPSAAEKNSTV